MTVQIVKLADVAAQPWRNGGGVTHELLAWPASAAAWQLRVSVATIAADGPFSPFPGVQRWFAVIEGEGVEVQFPHGAVRCTRSGEPLAFDGADAPMCTLLAGPTRDLNLMAQASAGRAAMRRVADAAPISTGQRWRGLFCAAAATLHEGSAEHRLPAMTLAWADAPSAPWRCTTDGAAWWLALDGDLTP